MEFELSTDQKGAIAESAIVHAAIKLGIGVYRPVADGERIDLIFDLRPRLVRVQCKTAVLRGEVWQSPSTLPDAVAKDSSSVSTPRTRSTP